MRFPKPDKKKQKRAKNNPKPTIEDKCYVCNAPYAATHEVFYGRGKRQLSIKYKMQAKLCYEHHEHTRTGIHFDKRFDFKVKQIYQRKFEKEYSREKFIEVFGRNYLDMSFEEYIHKGVVA